MGIFCALVEMFAAAIVGVLFVSGLKKQRDRTNLYLNALTATLLASILIDIPAWLLPDNSITIIKILLLADYALSYISIALFHYYLISYLNNKAGISMKFTRIVIPGTIIMPILWCVSMFNGMFFTINADGHYVHGEYYWISQWVAASIGVVDIILLLYYHKKMRFREMLALMSYEFFPLLAVLKETALDAVPLYLAMTLSLLIIYMVISVEQDKLLLKRELEIADGRTKIILSQIQPHFLYNSLVAIKHLCKTDSKIAAEAIEDFSHYLRANMDSLTINHCIPFTKELDHVQTYLSLEGRRFGKKLQVRFDIKESAFNIPPLTLQPIVENAVKYGTTQNMNGVTVDISTSSDDKNYYITVEDDGMGFDQSQKKEDGKTHIGIDSVRNRLQIMCEGNLFIESNPDKRGTLATLVIPKNV